MINYTTNQRRSINWTGSEWIEEVLTASGVEFDNDNFTMVSGSSVQEVIKAIDNFLTGFEVKTASGIVIIDDVINVSGVSTGSLGELETVVLPSGNDSIFKFSFTVPAQPADPVQIRLAYSAVTSGAEGTLKLHLDYNIFDQGDDLTPEAYTYALSGTQSLVSSNFEQMKLFNFSIPTTDFSGAGSAPFIVSAQITRDVSISGNYAGDIGVIQLVADNVPGGVTGNTAGYVGGNLEVTGDLTVQDTLIVQGGIVPASGTSAGVSGAIVPADNYLYIAIADNQWRRINLSAF